MASREVAFIFENLVHSLLMIMEMTVWECVALFSWEGVALFSWEGVALFSYQCGFGNSCGRDKRGQKSGISSN